MNRAVSVTRCPLASTLGDRELVDAVGAGRRTSVEGGDQHVGADERLSIRVGHTTRDGGGLRECLSGHAHQQGEREQSREGAGNTGQASHVSGGYGGGSWCGPSTAVGTAETRQRDKALLGERLASPIPSEKVGFWDGRKLGRGEATVKRECRDRVSAYPPMGKGVARRSVCNFVRAELDWNGGKADPGEGDRGAGTGGNSPFG